MTKNDFNSGPEPADQADSLSATGMFLRAFDSGTEQLQEPSEAPFAKPVASPGTSGAASSGPSVPRPGVPAPAPSGGGEFTQMFQSLEPRPNPESQPVAVQVPSVTQQLAQPPVQQAAPRLEPAAAPGEFTRIFVSAAAAPKEPPARAVLEPAATPPVSNPPRMKGFSTPGISDSASAEGSFTQFFKTTPVAQAPTPVPARPPVQPVQAFTAPTPAPLQPPQAPLSKDWPSEPDFGTPSKSSDAAPASGSATGLLSSLSSPSTPSPSNFSPAPRQPEPAPYRPEPLPSYSPAPASAAPSGVEAGSVTRLIQRLSQVPVHAPQEPTIAPSTVPSPALQASPGLSSGSGSSSGPGEFTRMISGDAVKAAIGAPAQPPAVPAQPAPAPFAPPPLPAVALPAFQAPAPAPAAKFEPPKFEPPKVAAPKLAPPALAAPKGKLEAMVPILLVVNTFLLIVLLVVVIFAMKAK